MQKLLAFPEMPDRRNGTLWHFFFFMTIKTRDYSHNHEIITKYCGLYIHAHLVIWKNNYLGIQFELIASTQLFLSVIIFFLLKELNLFKEEILRNTK